MPPIEFIEQQLHIAQNQPFPIVRQAAHACLLINWAYTAKD
jgi:hypothetical protein